ncbi:MAG: prepilin peptidase [Planctomycetes bacterium]|nr:prepilin peptidase [Planctomycetota bacterium]
MIIAITIPQFAMAGILFLLGCAVGSFLNVCIWRLPRGLSISKPNRSFCPHCKTPIAAFDNIPILSFLILRGRCRHCGEPISFRYPVIEGLTGLLFLGLYLLQGVGQNTGPGQLIIMGLLISLLVISSAVDMQFFIIPDEISVFGLFGGIIAGGLLPELHVGQQPYHTFETLTGLQHLDGLIGSLIGALGGGILVIFFAILGAVLFGKEAIGFGDVKLMAMVGAFLGWKVSFLAFFIAPFFGLIYGIPLLLLEDEHVMPYGPFLSSASVLIVLFRAQLCGILDHYVEVIGALFQMLFGGSPPPFT